MRRCNFVRSNVTCSEPIAVSIHWAGTPTLVFDRAAVVRARIDGHTARFERVVRRTTRPYAQRQLGGRYLGEPGRATAIRSQVVSTTSQKG